MTNHIVYFCNSLLLILCEILLTLCEYLTNKFGKKQVILFRLIMLFIKIRVFIP